MRSFEKDLRARAKIIGEELPSREMLTTSVLTTFSGKQLMKLLGSNAYPTKPKAELAELILKKLSHGMTHKQPAIILRPNLTAATQDATVATVSNDKVLESPKRKHGQLSVPTPSTNKSFHEVPSAPYAPSVLHLDGLAPTPQQKRSRIKAEPPQLP